MRLLYCSTIKYPTRLANRLQVMAMAKEFNKLLGKNFYLGGRRIALDNANDIDNVIIVKGKNKSYLLAWRYMRFIVNNYISHVYCRDDKLLFFIMLYSTLFFRRPLTFIYEMHRVPENLKFFHKIILKKVHHIIVLTNFIKKELAIIGIASNKIFISPDGVDVNQFTKIRNKKATLRSELELPNKKKIITYVGTYKTMGMTKGVEDLIEVFSNLLKTYKDIFLLLVGMNNEDIAELKMLLRRHKVSENCFKLIPFVPQQKAFAYMTTSNILIMNFPRKKHYLYYMSPLKMFEYMASGVPIITTDLPTVREVLNEKNAVLIKPEDKQELGQGIEKILYDKPLADKLSSQAFIEVQKYTWEKRTKLILECIK